MSPAQLEAMQAGRKAASAARQVNNSDQGWVTIADAARETGLSRNWINGLIKRGAIGLLHFPGSKRCLVKIEDVRHAIKSAYRPAKTNGVTSD